ncbi:MAG: LptA/OstA family protein [Rhodospirillales bacterium]
MITELRIRRRMVSLALAGLLLSLWPHVPVFAQSLNLTAGDDGGPVSIFAEDGIEWQQENLVFLARGNARAVRDNVEVNADVLKAYYHEVNGTSEIWRLDAEGSVVIESPNEKVTGDLAIYDVPKGVLLVRGRDIRFTAGPDVITAEQQLEYWEGKQLAVARGDAHAVRGDKQLDADVLAAYFKRQANGETDIERVEAFDNVRIETTTEVVTADRGIYMVQSGLATLTGSVKITRGGNVITGCKATVNLNTGISRMFACADGSGTRVQGSILPETTEETRQ